MTHGSVRRAGFPASPWRPTLPAYLVIWIAARTGLRHYLDSQSNMPITVFICKLKARSSTLSVS